MFYTRSDDLLVWHATAVEGCRPVIPAVAPEVESTGNERDKIINTSDFSSTIELMRGYLALFYAM